MAAPLGTWTLDYDGATSTGLSSNAAASDVHAALEGMSSIGTDNVDTLTGGPAFVGSMTVTYASLFDTAPTFTVDKSNLLGSGVSIAIATTRDYVASVTAVSEVQAVYVSGASSGTFRLGFSGATTAGLNWNATAGEVQVALRGLSTIGGTNIGVSGSGISETPLTGTFLDTFGPASLIVGNATGLDNADTGVPTGGTYTLATGGETTAGLSYNAAASDVQAALESLSAIGTGNMGVAGTLTSGFTLTYADTLGNVAQIASGGESFTGGITPALSFDTTQNGVAGVTGVSEVQTTFVSGAAGGTFRLWFTGATTGGITWNATASQVASALTGLTTIGTGNVVSATGAGVSGDKWTITYKNTLGNVALVAGINTGLSADPGWATSGTVMLDHFGESTSALNYNASSAEVQSALAALVTLGAAENVVVYPAVNWPDEMTACFAPAIGDPVVLTSANFLTGGNSPGFSFATTQAWAAEVSAVVEIQVITLTSCTSGTWHLSYDAGSTWSSALAYSASAGTVEAEVESESGAGCVVSGDAGGPYTITFDNAQAQANVMVESIDLDGTIGSETTQAGVDYVAAVPEIQTITPTSTPYTPAVVIEQGDQGVAPVTAVSEVQTITLDHGLETSEVVVEPVADGVLGVSEVTVQQRIDFKAGSPAYQLFVRL
jgi:hypothetical protein